MRYYTKRAQELLSAARPLMDIYRIDNKNEFNAFLQVDSEAIGNAQEHPLVACRSTRSTRLLLVEMLEQGLGSMERRRAGIAAAACCGTSARSCIFSKPARSMSRYRCLTREEFEVIPAEPSTFRTGVLRAGRRVHVQAVPCAPGEHTDRFAAEHPRYQVEKTSSQTFRNLQISIHEGKWAMVSKELGPAIHFVIHHPKLRRAIEEFIPPVVERASSL